MRNVIASLVVFTAGWDMGPSSCLAEERRDLFGDPLPPAAMARLGTLRLRHSGPIDVFALSADGKLLACAASDQARFRWSGSTPQPAAITVWDLDTNQERRRITAAGRITALKFTPDGKRLAVIDGKLRLWDIDSGRELPLKAPPLQAAPLEATRSLSFTPDGQQVAAVLPARKVLLWDVTRDREVRQFDLSAETVGHSVQVLISPDGQLLAAADHAAGYFVWKLATGALLHRIPAQPQRYAGASHGGVIFSPDGRLLLTCGRDQVAHVWDTATWKELRQFDREPLPTWFLGVLADNRTAIIADFLTGVSAWDLTTGKKMRDITRQRFTGAMSADGKTLARLLGQSFEILDVATGQPRGGVPGPTRSVEGIAPHPSGKRVALATDRVRLFELDTGRELPFDAPQERASAVAYSPDGRTLLAATPDPVLRLKDEKLFGETPERVLQLLDANTGKLVRAFVGAAGEVEWIRFLPDGKTALTYARWRHVPNGQRREEGARVWDVAAGKEVRQVAIPAADRVIPSADGRRLVCGLQLLDVETGRQLGSLTGPQIMTYSLALSRSNRLVAAGVHNYATRQPELHVWEAASLKPLHQWPTASSVISSLAFSPDERFLAAGGTDTVIRLWDLESGRERKALRGHRSFAAALAFTADGRRLISGGADAQALVWDLADLVAAPAPAAAPTATELAALWADLLNEDPRKSEPAFHRLARSPAEVLPFLRQQLQKPPAVDAKTITRWIHELDSDEFKTRNTAEKELANLGARAEESLRAAAISPRSEEQRKRLQALLARLSPQLNSPPVLRQVRCVAILERVGTSFARETLDFLTGDGFAPRVAEEARAALQRLKARERE